jgi:hypothetical protein
MARARRALTMRIRISFLAISRDNSLLMVSPILPALLCVR